MHITVTPSHFVTYTAFPRRTGVYLEMRVWPDGDCTFIASPGPHCIDDLAELVFRAQSDLNKDNHEKA